jgi:hypothetical protein
LKNVRPVNTILEALAGMGEAQFNGVHVDTIKLDLTYQSGCVPLLGRGLFSHRVTHSSSIRIVTSECLPRRQPATRHMQHVASWSPDPCAAQPACTCGCGSRTSALRCLPYACSSGPQQPQLISSGHVSKVEIIAARDQPHAHPGKSSGYSNNAAVSHARAVPPAWAMYPYLLGKTSTTDGTSGWLRGRARMGRPLVSLGIPFPTEARTGRRSCVSVTCMSVAKT